MSSYLNLKMNQAYQHMILSTDRYCILIGGAGSGKSYAVAQRLIVLLVSLKYCKVLLVRQTHRSIRESSFALLKSIILGTEAAKDFEFVDSRLEIKYKINGNRVISQGLDDSEKLKSITDITHVWVEEATEIRELDFEQIDLRLRYQNADHLQIMLTFNPVGESHWIRKRFFEKQAKNAFTLKTTYRDNLVNLPVEYIETIENLKNSNAGMYQIYARGEWSNITENGVFSSEYYQEFEEVDNDTKRIMYVDPNIADKGKGDTTAIVVMGYSHTTGKIQIYDIYCNNIRNSNDLFNTIARLAEKWNVRAIDMDGNVTQENTYSNLLRYWIREKGIKLRVQFRHYRVNELSKAAQFHWVSGDYEFAPDLYKREPQFFAQLYSFEGTKKQGGRDDAPDAFISATASLYQYRFISFRRNKNNATT